MLSVLCVACLLWTGSPGQAQVRFRITTRTVASVDMSSVGQGTQSFTYSSSAVVTAAIRDSAGAPFARIVIDSNTFDGGEATGFLASEMTRSPVGAVFDMPLRNGRPPSPITAIPMSVQAGLLVPGIELVLNGMQRHQAGDHWVDTTHAAAGLTQSAASGRRIISWQATTAEGGMLRLKSTWAGITVVGAGLLRMEMQVSGTSQVVGAAEGLIDHGTTSATGRAAMNLGYTSVPMLATTEISVMRLP